MSNLLKKDKGFTLIEIVLVLAIAGLLLVIVFLAVSGAQKSRRDSQRKSDTSRLAAQIEAWASNHAGVYPTVADFATPGWDSYKPANFTDPTGGAAYPTPAATLGTAVGSMSYQLGTGTTCDDVTNSSGRIYTLRMQLEQGVACRDNK